MSINLIVGQQRHEFAIGSIPVYLVRALCPSYRHQSATAHFDGLMKTVVVQWERLNEEVNRVRQMAVPMDQLDKQSV